MSITQLFLSQDRPRHRSSLASMIQSTLGSHTSGLAGWTTMTRGGTYGTYWSTCVPSKIGTDY